MGTVAIALAIMLAAAACGSVILGGPHRRVPEAEPQELRPEQRPARQRAGPDDRRRPQGEGGHDGHLQGGRGRGHARGRREQRRPAKLMQVAPGADHADLPGRLPRGPGRRRDTGHRGAHPRRAGSPRRRFLRRPRSVRPGDGDQLAAALPGSRAQDLRRRMHLRRRQQRRTESDQPVLGRRHQKLFAKVCGRAWDGGYVSQDGPFDHAAVRRISRQTVREMIRSGEIHVRQS